MTAFGVVPRVSPLWRKIEAEARERNREAERIRARHKRHQELTAMIAEIDRCLGALSMPDWKRLVHDVCRRHKVSWLEVCSQRRAAYIIPCRQECMFVLATQTTFSLPQVGRLIGGRDHTTVIHGIRRHKERVAGRLPVPPPRPSIKPWNFFWTEEKLAEARRLIDSGLLQREAGAIMGVSGSALGAALLRHHYKPMQEAA